MTTYEAAFKTTRKALTTKMYHARRPLLVEAARLNRAMGDRTSLAFAARLEVLAEIPNFADFQEALAA